MKYAVDSIVDEIAVIEEVETGDKKEVSLEILPEEIQVCSGGRVSGY